MRKELEKCTKEGESYYFNGELHEAYEIFLRCENLALELSDSEWIAETTKNVGRILHRIGKYVEAKEKYLKALEITKKLKLISKNPKYLNHLANVYQFTNEFKEQYDCLQEALKISIEFDDQYTIAKIHNSLGVYYEHLGNYQQALEYMQKALDYFSTHKNEKALVKTLNLISSVKTKMGYFKDALKDAQRAYSMSNQDYDNYNLAHSLTNIITIYYNQGDLEGCSKYFDELLEVKDKLENIKMGCDILIVIGLVYQEFNKIKKAFKAFSESLETSKQIKYYHGIAKSNELLGDLFYKNNRYLESYRFYSNSLNVFQSIFNSIKEPSLKESYKNLFESLPEIIKKVDTLLSERSYDLSSKELEEISKEATNLCFQVKAQNFEGSISKDCSENVKQLNTNKKKEINIRQEIKKEWQQILTESCFIKLDVETQDILIRYKLNEKLMPDDYESIIQKIAKAVECEIRAKLFEGYYNYWHTKVKLHLKDNITEVTDRFFESDYYNLKKFLENNKPLELKPIYNILLNVLHRNYINHIPEEYFLPFEKFREYIGINNLIILKNIIRFFDRKYKCGKTHHNFIDIRNKCAHGGGRFQEQRINKEIQIGRDTLEEILSCLIDKDIELLMNFCSLDL